MGWADSRSIFRSNCTSSWMLPHLLKFWKATVVATNVPTSPSNYSPRIWNEVHSSGVDENLFGVVFEMHYVTIWKGVALPLLGWSLLYGHCRRLLLSRLWCLEKPCKIKMGISQKRWVVIVPLMLLRDCRIYLTWVSLFLLAVFFENCNLSKALRPNRYVVLIKCWKKLSPEEQEIATLCRLFF